jgi:hypothetical protein
MADSTAGGQNLSPNGDRMPAAQLAGSAEECAKVAWRGVNLSRQSTVPDVSRAARTEAAIYARVGETFAMRDLADSNRDLARAQNQLALSVDALVDELRIRRGVPEDAT